MADSPRAHRIIVFALACQSAVLLRERLVGSTVLSFVAWVDPWRPAIPLVGLAASHE